MIGSRPFVSFVIVRGGGSAASGRPVDHTDKTIGTLGFDKLK